MKIRSLLTILLILIGLNTPLFAQTTLPPAQSPQNPPVQSPNECNDNKDNDGDGKVDAADPQCKTGVKCENGTTSCISQSSGATAPAYNASDFQLQVKINNPLKVDTIEGALELFMKALLRIALPFIIVFFIWSGFSFVLARGNPEKVGNAKRMFWYTIIGTLLILGAWVITNAIIGTVNSITK